MVRIKVREISIYCLMLSHLSWEDNLVFKFKSGGLHKKLLEFWMRLSVCLNTEENQEKLCPGGCEQDNDTALHIHTRYSFTPE
jgi:hypothetical protein